MEDTIIKMSTDFIVTKFDAEVGDIEAYVTTYGNEDVVGDVMAKGVLDKFIRGFKRVNGKKPYEKQLPMLWQHDSNEVIGSWTNFKADDIGVIGYGKLFPEISRAQDVRSLIMRGMVGAVSIGFKATDYEIREDGGRLFKEIQLVETSVVLRPANPQALILSAKNDEGQIDLKLVEKVLRDAGLSRKQSKAMVAEGKSGLRDADLNIDKLDDLFARLKSEIKR